MPRPHIMTVRSNFKSPGGSAWKANLSPKTLIVGRNGSGKSRTTQAAEVAIQGCASDVAGRVVSKSKPMLSRLGSGEDIFAAVTFSNGETCHWSLTSSHGQKPSILALPPVLEALTGSDNKAYRALIQWCGQRFTRDEVESVLEAAGLDADSILSPKLKSPEELTKALLTALDTAESERRKKLKEIKELGARRDRVIEDLTKLAHIGDLDEARSAVEVIEDRILGAGIVEAADADFDGSVQKLLAEYRAAAMTYHTLIGQQGQKTRLQGSLAKLREADKHAREDSADAKLIIDALAQTMANLVAAHGAEFCRRVQQYLPAEKLIGIETHPFRVGLVRQGREGCVVHSACSGAEWVMLSAAIAAATAAPGPAVLVLQDRAWDAQTLGEAMAALGRWDGQVLITSTIEPELPVTGWRVVRIGGGEE